jgi:D-3-phosphoglycerate dehydrogenase
VPDVPLVFVAQPIDADSLALLEQRTRVVRGFGPGAVALAEVLNEVEVLVVRTERLPATVFEGAPRLRLVQRVGIGVDGIDLAAASAAGVPVFNTAGGNVHTVAEMTIGLALAVARQLPRWDRAVREGRFAERELDPGRQLHGLTWGIVGLGTIGTEVGRIARTAFGMRVLASHPSRDDDWIASRGAEPVTLEVLLAESDVVSLHVPRTPQNRGMIGAPQLALMRPRSILVNVSRGGVVDESALAAALRDNRIGGAGVDVFEDEPPQAQHPFTALENVVLSPHRAGRTVEATEGQGRTAVERVLALLEAPSVEGALNAPDLGGGA